MDHRRFDLDWQHGSMPKSRRTAAHLLARSAFGGLLGAGALGTRAKKKKKKKVTLCHQGQTIKVAKKAKKKHTAHGDTLGTCPASPPPPPPPPPGTTTTTTTPAPLPTGPGFCGYDGSSTGFAGAKRYLQTFLPPQGGQITGAGFTLRGNPADFNLTVDVRSVDSLGVPGNSIFGSEQVVVSAATVFPATQAVDMIFAPPVPVALGTAYALTLTAFENFGIHANNAGNPCPDGQLFSDSFASGILNDLGGVADMVYSVTIVD